jgi:hypothetical protein
MIIGFSINHQPGYSGIKDYRPTLTIFTISLRLNLGARYLHARILKERPFRVIELVFLRSRCEV